MGRHTPGSFIRYSLILFNLGYDVCDIKLLYFYWQTIQICRAVVTNLPLQHPFKIWYRIKIAKLITCVFHTYNNQCYIMYIWYKLYCVLLLSITAMILSWLLSLTIKRIIALMAMYNIRTVKSNSTMNGNVSRVLSNNGIWSHTARKGHQNSSTSLLRAFTFK